MADISNGNTVPATIAGVMNDTQWGIDNTLSGFIVQSEDYNEDRSTDQTQDQKGRVVYDLDYDRHYTCTLQVIGTGNLSSQGCYVGSTTFQWQQSPTISAKTHWKVQSIAYNGSYNDKKKYTINLERWQNYPA